MLTSSNHSALGWDRQCAHSRHVSCLVVYSQEPLPITWSLGSPMWPPWSLLLALLPSVVMHLIESQSP